MSDKKAYICLHTVVGYDELEGRFTKRPGEALYLDPSDKDTERLLQRGSIRADGDEKATAPSVFKEPMPHVDTSGAGDGDGLGDDDVKGDKPSHQK